MLFYSFMAKTSPKSSQFRQLLRHVIQVDTGTEAPKEHRQFFSQ